jgi:hypothetical protein
MACGPGTVTSMCKAAPPAGCRVAPAVLGTAGIGTNFNKAGNRFQQETHFNGAGSIASS